MLVVNAANSKKDLEWLEQQNSMNAGLEDRSDRYALLAIQGPESVQILQKLTDTDLSEIPFYSFKTGNVDRKSTRLNSSHVAISYAVFCLKKKKLHESFKKHVLEHLNRSIKSS